MSSHEEKACPLFSFTYLATNSTIVATTKIPEKATNATIKPTAESRKSLRLDCTSCSNSFIATPPIDTLIV